MFVIDGARGEGGGQVLRTSLSAAAVLGRELSLTRIRAGRAKAGLLRQHLTAVQAAAALCDAEVEGAELGSTALSFRPGPLRAGRWRFDIGSAGSSTLVLQTVLPLMLRAPGPTEVVVTGGTHNPAAPPVAALDRSFLPVLRAMGADVTLNLDRWGFFPAGGGQVTLRVQPRPLAPVHLRVRGPLTGLRAVAAVSALPVSVARRELAVLGSALGVPGLPPLSGRVIEVPDPRGPGNAVWVEASFEGGCEVVTGFGEKGVRAEAVAAGVAEELLAWYALDVPVGAHLADQLLLPMALAGGGSFRSGPPTLHTTTNAALVRELFGVDVELEETRPTWDVRVGPPAPGPTAS